MTRRLIMSFSLGLAALAACQTELATTTDTAEQEISSCDGKMPDLPIWRGEQLPSTTSSQIYLVYADSEKRGQSVIVLVDLERNDILFGYRMKSSQQGGLLDSLDNAAQYAVGRVPVPPRPLLPWDLKTALIAWGQLAIDIPARAGEAGVCEQQ